MKIVKKIQEVRKLVAEAKSAGKTIGLVPTMGALHEGHFSLIRTAKKQTDFVVVSIFVNPTQFGPTEDIDKYPRTLDADTAGCEKSGADVIFAPTPDEIYPQQNLSWGNVWVNVEKLDQPLCGRNRPGHFRGVATVCAKLFNIVQPDAAFFGQKDAQQSIIIQRMVADLNMPLKIVVCPTVREKDGLAMSSRNRYLNADERKDAALLYAALQEAEILIAGGLRDSKKIIGEMEKIIKLSGRTKIDYIDIVNTKTLKEVEQVRGETLLAIAVKIGSARLIDNIIVDCN
ncbi:MAG TPA: pantoate--beta-alanine ligase [Phycisphaerales bacterium]|nr:MAG: pantoate--beta-alanine ligase [Planctomycetes bacterium GWC2_45_44]HBG79063.1 pantoate--beta-alanine ligase [Phycisphaerales bacterium]HBR19515.1 pantoate--beta-alanine ligase [Phycisphaerales bacterium]